MLGILIDLSLHLLPVCEAHLPKALSEEYLHMVQEPVLFPFRVQCFFKWKTAFILHRLYIIGVIRLWRSKAYSLAFLRRGAYQALSQVVLIRLLI